MLVYLFKIETVHVSGQLHVFMQDCSQRLISIVSPLAGWCYSEQLQLDFHSTTIHSKQNNQDTVDYDRGCTLLKKDTRKTILKWKMLLKINQE